MEEPSQLGLIYTLIGRWWLSKGEDSGVRRSSPLVPTNGEVDVFSLQYCNEQFGCYYTSNNLGSHSFQFLWQLFPFFLCRWDPRTSAVTPEDDVFYLVALLRSALDNGEPTQSLEYLSHQNHQILEFCYENGIEVKQYLPHYTTEEEWADHFGDKWPEFQARKMKFDPHHILATGQKIFPAFKPGNTAVSRWLTRPDWHKRKQQELQQYAHIL